VRLSSYPKLTALLPAAMAISLVACLDTLNDVSPASTSSSSSSSSGATSTASTGSGPAPATFDVGSVVMHRLTNVEYDSTVRDLLGDTTHPSQTLQFDADLGGSGFDNDSQALTIDDGRFSLYAQAAEQLSIAALAAGSPARATILTCDGTSNADACARTVLGAFASRAWRRPIQPDELDRLAFFQTVATAQGEGFERGIQLGLQAALLSPNFIFHIELDPTPDSLTPHALSDYEVASRLSYFLWSSLPDAALVAAADAGKLTADPTEIERQARRMIDDGKADTLVRNFTRGWLQTRRLEISTYDPDPSVFPAYNVDLRTSMEGETEAFFQSFLHEDKSALDLLTAPYSYVDERLAAYYGIAGIQGTTFQKAPLTGTNRAGILTQAAVLRATSLKTRTSPTLRGAFVLGQLLCSPPGAPPPGVPMLDDSPMAAGTLRERLEEHRKNAVCASCHTSMDPLGFGLEHFDAIGEWREMDSGAVIDATGQFPDGEKFDGAPQMVAELVNDPRFTSCLTKQMFTYAHGRDPTAIDKEVGGRMDRLTDGFKQKNFNVRELIVSLITDDAFTSRHGIGGM
jgi:hypothetical protein